MGAWIDQVHRRAALVHNQIAAAISVAPATGVPAEQLIAPYQRLLDRLYLDELPYARLIDDAHLVITAEGRATETEEPRISALTHLLDRLRDETRRLAKVVGGIRDDERVDNIDLLLAGLARGSLVVGLKIVPPMRDSKQMSFLTEDEPVFRAVKAAIQSLSEIPHLLSAKGVDEEISDLLPDPAVRDATLVTAQRLSPSGRMGIDRVEISSPGVKAGVLTIDERNILRRAIARPHLRQPRKGSFKGIVRELDLDAKRIEIRNVPAVGTIRCVLEQIDAERARRWINRLVSVSGMYERDAAGRPSLLRVTKVTVQKSPRQLPLRHGKP